MSKLGYAALAMAIVACIARSNNPPPQYGSPGGAQTSSSGDTTPADEVAARDPGEGNGAAMVGVEADGTVSDGGRAVCNSGTCNMRCKKSDAQGGCVFVCKAGTTCNTICEMERCTTTCMGDAKCNSTCPAGGCTIHCSDTAVCNSTCTGGECIKDYTDQATGTFTCEGGHCDM